jgi:hypothetical protein
MKTGKIFFAACAVLFICLAACSSQTPQVTGNPQSSFDISVIAVLPVECAAGDVEVSHLLQEKLLKELHFKGYPPVSAEIVDGKLNCKSAAAGALRRNTLTARTAHDQTNPDAVMHCSLLENTTSKRLFYAPVTVSLGCELRTTATGETLWAARHRTTCRSFDLFRNRLDMKARGSLETALEEAVTTVLETLPYGPQLRG